MKEYIPHKVIQLVRTNIYNLPIIITFSLMNCYKSIFTKHLRKLFFVKYVISEVWLEIGIFLKEFIIEITGKL